MKKLFATIVTIMLIWANTSGQSTWEQPMSQAYPLGIKTETIVKGDTTFIKHWYATVTYSTSPPQYGGWEVIGIDTFYVSKGKIEITPSDWIKKAFPTHTDSLFMDTDRLIDSLNGEARKQIRRQDSINKKSHYKQI